MGYLKIQKVICWIRSVPTELWSLHIFYDPPVYLFAKNLGNSQ